MLDQAMRKDIYRDAIEADLNAGAGNPEAAAVPSPLRLQKFLFPRLFVSTLYNRGFDPDQNVLKTRLGLSVKQFIIQKHIQKRSGK